MGADEVNMPRNPFTLLAKASDDGMSGAAPERSSAMARRELVEFSLHHGYRSDGLIQIIEAIR